MLKVLYLLNIKLCFFFSLKKNFWNFKEYLREQEQKRPISDKNYSSSQSTINSSKIVSKNFIIYELQVYVRTRNYQINHSDKLEYDVYIITFIFFWLKLTIYFTMNKYSL